MRHEGLNYTPPADVLERTRLFFLRTAWHRELMDALWQEAQKRLQSLNFPQERVHVFTVAGAFELVQAAGTIVRYYTWQVGFQQVVSVQGPTRIQSNLKLPPFFQGNFDSQLRSEFLLESPGPIGYFQPYQPGLRGDLPAIIALGCILKGATEHNRYLSHAVIGSLAQLNLQSGIPIILGVLTPDTLKQAHERVPQAADWVDAAFMSWEARLQMEQVFMSLPNTQKPTDPPA